MLGHPSVGSTAETREIGSKLRGRVYMYRAALWDGDCVRDMVSRALTRDWEYVPADDDLSTPEHFWNPNTDSSFDLEGNLLSGRHDDEEPYAPMPGAWDIVGTDTDTFPSCVDGLSSDSDTPEHCDACGRFLKNGLTEDGILYVKEKVAEAIRDGRQGSTALQIWAPFYGLEPSED